MAAGHSAASGKKSCEDVFVTSGGAKTDELLGWVTDNIIQANLQT